MCVYLHTKSQVSSIILTSFRQVGGGGVGNFTPWAPKKPTHIKVEFCSTLQWRDTIIPLKLSSWNIICFWQKEPINVQFFRLLSALMKVHPFLHAIFETTRSGFIQFFIKMSQRITVLAQTSSTLDKKSPSKSNFQIFAWLGENSKNSSCHIWNHKSVFL